MDIQLPQIIFQIINFGVVAGALTYFLYKPVQKMLDERSAKVEAAQKAAEITLAEKRQIDEMKKKAQKEAEKEAGKILAEAREAAEKMEKEIVDSATKKARDEIVRLHKDWENEKEKAWQDMRAEFVKDVSIITENLIGTSFDPKQIAKQMDENLTAITKRI